MAYVTGTATDYADLLSRLITFLTTNATLVADNEDWAVLSNNATDGETSYLLRGPGLAATDQIHVQISRDSNVGSDIYGWNLRGFDSYNASLGHAAQPGISSATGIALWNNSIPYWFIANGRRFIVVAKVSTVYVSLYAGFYLPYATPGEMPYPIAVLASHGDATTRRWSDITHSVGGCFDPASGNAYLRYSDGVWLAVANYQNGSGNVRDSLAVTGVWPYDTDLTLRENLDGSQSLLPTVMHSSYGSANVFGELQGVFFTSAFGLGSEDTITIGGDTYLIVQSVYRTDRRSYAAFKLE